MFDDHILKTIAIIPCAGSGVRMGADRAKQYLEIVDRPYSPSPGKIPGIPLD